MRPTEGTILSVVRAAADGAIDSDEKDIVDLMGVVVDEAKKMLDKTPELLPALKKANVVDSGGMGLYIIFKAMYEALRDDIKLNLKMLSLQVLKLLEHQEQKI